MVDVSGAMFTSNTDDWATPQAFFDALDAEFHFTLDVAASKDNAKCGRFFSLDCSAFLNEWTGTIWMNPPYGRRIREWVKRAYEASLNGNTVVCLLPARTDTSWWHDYCMKGEIRFVRGRLCFNDGKGRAPFPSAVVIFRGKK